ncbi:MAG: small basic family protein [Firmicutes bacterium]|nr:small basic family protein [Bacillota bacterium]MBQ3122986.1 small basic family protein [Bacillota bacterium]MBQ9972350.1 small basic family protein [Bacillota bacterium]
MIFAIFAGLAGGLIIGFAFNITYPTEYSFYITMALLAGMDSIVGAARAHLQEKYNGVIFITGFICNAILAALLTFVGDKLGIPLYYAAIFVFGGRLFNNMAVIRRIIVENYLSKKNKM